MSERAWPPKNKMKTSGDFQQTKCWKGQNAWVEPGKRRNELFKSGKVMSKWVEFDLDVSQGFEEVRKIIYCMT